MIKPLATVSDKRYGYLWVRFSCWGCRSTQCSHTRSSKYVLDLNAPSQEDRLRLVIQNNVLIDELRQGTVECTAAPVASDL